MECLNIAFFGDESNFEAHLEERKIPYTSSNGKYGTTLMTQIEINSKLTNIRYINIDDTEELYDLNKLGCVPKCDLIIFSRQTSDRLLNKHLDNYRTVQSIFPCTSTKMIIPNVSYVEAITTHIKVFDSNSIGINRNDLIKVFDEGVTYDMLISLFKQCKVNKVDVLENNSKVSLKLFDEESYLNNQASHYGEYACVDRQYTTVTMRQSDEQDDKRTDDLTDEITLIDPLTIDSLNPSFEIELNSKYLYPTYANYTSFTLQKSIYTKWKLIPFFGSFDGKIEINSLVSIESHNKSFLTNTSNNWLSLSPKGNLWIVKKGVVEENEV